MTEKINHWFKLDIEFAFDPRIQTLHETLQRRYIMLQCLNVKFPLSSYSAEELAFALRISEEELHTTIEKLQEKGLVTEDLNIVDWDKKLAIPSSSADRVRRFRQKQKPVTDVTLHVTQPCNDVTLLDKIREDKIIKKNKQKKDGDVTLQKFDVTEKPKPDYPELFLRWWEDWFVECVNKGSKPQAHEKWRRLTKKNPDLATELILQRDKQKQQIFWCRKYNVWRSPPQQPLVWLNQSGWTYEIKTEAEIAALAPQPKPGGFNQPLPTPLTAEQREAKAEERKAERLQVDEANRKREELWKTKYPDVFNRLPVSLAWAECQRLDKEKMAKTA